VVIGGTREFAAQRERVWDLLVDPHVLADFLPGLESLEVADETHWSALMRLPHSPVSLKLAFELAERRRPEHALLHADGKKLGASVAVRTAFDLTDAAGATAMAWSADVALGGMLRRVESALKPVAQHQAEHFLDGLEKKLG